MNRACITRGCPRFAVVGGRGHCARHRQTTSQRGYDAEHQAERRAIARSLPAPCVYCRIVIRPGEDFVAAHWEDRDPSSPRVPAHTACNERAKDGQLRPVVRVA